MSSETSIGKVAGERGNRAIAPRAPEGDRLDGALAGPVRTGPTLSVVPSRAVAKAFACAGRCPASGSGAGPNARFRPAVVRSLRLQLDEARRQAARAEMRAAEMAAVAEQARARQVEFLAVIAHELRNPLAPIRTAAALLSLGRPGDLLRAQAIIERQVVQMSRMIDDLLDVSRVHTGKMTLVSGIVRISEVVGQSIDACLPAITKRHQRLQLLGLDGDCEVHGDTMRMTQVLSNLLDNASKYSPDGQAIVLTVRMLEQFVELEVVDDGIGISASALGKVFEPFVRDGHAASFNTSGLGVGLAVVRELVEAHGGQVTARSAGVGHGSRFLVALPRAQMPVDVRPAPEAQGQSIS